jgi:hypothetical protein
MVALWRARLGMGPGLIKLDVYFCYVMAMLIIVLVTTILFYGTYRFTMLWEIYAIPYVAKAFGLHADES